MKTHTHCTAYYIQLISNYMSSESQFYYPVKKKTYIKKNALLKKICIIGIPLYEPKVSSRVEG